MPTLSVDQYLWYLHMTVGKNQSTCSFPPSHRGGSSGTGFQPFDQLQPGVGVPAQMRPKPADSQSKTHPQTMFLKLYSKETPGFQRGALGGGGGGGVRC